MSELVEQRSHSVTLCDPPGGSAAVLGHVAANESAVGEACCPDRGRQVDEEQARGDTPGEGGSMVQADAADRPPGLADARLGKKRHRRRPSKKKRHWKPYFKLSWEEKKALEERETARASRMRAEMFAKGLPVAPYNTTQFLMEEHDQEEPDLNTGGRFLATGRPEESASEDECAEAEEEDEEEGSDGIGRPGSAGGGEFLQRDFSETYEMYHVESLQNMSKQELVREYLELEKCMSRLEEENNRLRRAGGSARLGELEGELERLRAHNSELLLLLQNQRAQERPHAE